MKICHVISNLSVGGAEKQFVNTLNGLLDEDTTAILLSPSPRDNLESSLNKRVKIVRFNVKALFFPFHVLKLALFLKKEKFDVVHSHMYWPSMYAVIAARLAGTQLIVTSDHGIEPFRTNLMGYLDGQIINRYENLRICVSEDIKKARNKFINVHKAITLPNCTNVTDNHKIEYANQNGILSLVLIGRLIPEKGISVAIDAIELILKSKLKVHLKIIGSGPLHSNLEELIHKKGLMDYITLLGSRTDIKEQLLSSDIFIMPSLTEGQPLALLEAMSMAMPIVATSVGGIPDTIESNVEGLLLQPNNPVVLAKSITMLCNSLELRRELGCAAYIKVKSMYSVEGYSIRLLEIYSKYLRK